MEKHQECPELWFRPSPTLPFEVLSGQIRRREMTQTFRLGKRDGTHPKGYVPGTLALLRLFDSDNTEREHACVRIMHVESKSLRDFDGWESIRSQLSFFEGRTIASTEHVSVVTFAYNPNKEGNEHVRPA
jgi:hypothetical protein